MNLPIQQFSERVLIASGNPLFGRGLQKLIQQRWHDQKPEIRMTRSTTETLEVMNSWNPGLVIVDYDDVNIDRGEFLSSFVTGERPMQVILVSLQETGGVVVYDRRTLSPAQASDWLNSTQLGETPLSTQPSRRSSSMRHIVIVGILVAVTTTIVYLLLTTIGILPIPASLQAGPIDGLFRKEFFVIAFLFSLITVLMVYSMIVFRSRKDQPQEGKFFKGSSKLEIFWTVIPLLTVLYFSFIGSQGLAQLRRADPQAMTVEVTGGQWYWSFAYPDFGITTNELYLPVNRQVLLKLTSVDVIHSFWVPEFRVKQDLLPGENLVRELRIDPTKIGNYKVRCAEMCGVSHAYMESPVVVVSQADFDTWVNDQVKASAANPEERGQKLAQSSGCLSCHSVDGSAGVGPTWKGLYESNRQLTDGTTAVADEDYLHTSIVDPNVHVVQGFPPNVMPKNYGQTLNDQQIQDIIAFIETLR